MSEKPLRSEFKGSPMLVYPEPEIEGARFVAKPLRFGVKKAARVAEHLSELVEFLADNFGEYSEECQAGLEGVAEAIQNNEVLQEYLEARKALAE